MLLGKYAGPVLKRKEKEEIKNSFSEVLIRKGEKKRSERG